MSYTTKIEVGQKWRSRDPRDNGRTVTVIEVDAISNQPGNRGFVVVKSARRSRLRAITLYERYDLVRAS